MESINDLTIADGGFGLQGVYEQLKGLDESISLIEDKITYEEYWIERVKRETEPSAEPLHEVCSRHTLEVLQRTRQTLATMRELQTYLRSNAILRARSTSSSPHILDFPDEILMKICEYVKDWKPSTFIFSEFSTRVKEVKTLRLTCWRLCNASSHLLLHHVIVKLNPTSLARLEEISQHPTISRGIHAVRVELNYYDQMLAHEFDEFLRFHMNRLQIATNWMEEHHNREYFQDVNPKEDVLAKIKIYKRMFTAWTAWLENDISEIDMLHMEPIIECHAQYKELFSVQDGLLDGGLFEQRIAVAFSKMPMAGRLELQDDRNIWSDSRSTPWHSELDLSGALDFKHMLKPFGWHLCRSYNFAGPPVSLLVTLPIALHTAGHNLVDLHIEVSNLGNCSALVVRDQKREQFDNAMHRLKNFKFSDRNQELDDAVSPQQLDDIGCVFTGVFNSKCLQNVQLDLGCLWRKENGPPSFSLGSLIRLRTWKELSCLSMLSVPIHLHELQTLLDNIAEKPRYLALSSLHLLSGTWTQALDVLRIKDMGHVNLDRPSGAEIDHMTEEELMEIFTRVTDDYWRESPAESYIMQRLNVDRNPLLPKLALGNNEVSGG